MRPHKEMNWKKVSKEEFDAFVASYPNQLQKAGSAISEPPVVFYHDFSRGKKSPDSIVGRVWIYEDYPKPGEQGYQEDGCYKWEPNQHELRVTPV